MHHRSRPQTAPPRHAGPKPALTMIHLPYYRVRQRHLEEYLAVVYRLDRFNFLQASGTTPGMCPEYRVTANLPAAHRMLAEAERIRDGHHSSNVALILNVLCLDGYIPAGEYTIDTHPEPPPAETYRALLVQRADPAHPDCVAFRHEHQRNRAFTQLAAKMDQAVQAQKEMQCEPPHVSSR